MAPATLPPRSPTGYRPRPACPSTTPTARAHYATDVDTPEYRPSVAGFRSPLLEQAPARGGRGARPRHPGGAHAALLYGHRLARSERAPRRARTAVLRRGHPAHRRLGDVLWLRSAAPV